MRSNAENLILLFEDGTSFLVSKKKDFHSHFGSIKSSELKLGKLRTSKGCICYALKPSFVDLFWRIKRAAQVVLPKDAALILAEAMPGRNAIVIEAGVGSGMLGAFFAQYCKKVVSYDVRKSFIRVAKQNRDFLKLKNWTIKEGDARKGFDEKNADLIVLDLPYPHECLDACKSALKRGGFLSTYLPNMTQVIQFVNSLKEKGFVYLKTLEVFKREWIIKEKIARPEHHALSHTGFLSFARKV